MTPGPLTEAALAGLLAGKPGLVGLEFDPETAWLTAWYDPARLTFRAAEELARAVAAAIPHGAEARVATAPPASLRGYPSVRHRLAAAVDEHDHGGREVSGEMKLALAATCLAALLVSIPAERFLPDAGRVQAALAVVAYLAGGALSTAAALRALSRYSLDIDSLMVIAALGAAAIGRWREGGVLLFLFSLSNALETLAMHRTRGAIRSLIGLTPEEATIRRNGTESRVAIASLAPGDHVVVLAGERIPVDGTVHEGESEVDASMLSGESRWLPKRPGDPVFAGTLNQTGTLVCATTRPASDTYLARIIRMVEAAQGTKAKLHRMVDNFGRVYTPLVLLGAAAAFLAFWLGGGREPYDAFYRSMVVLVVASPCALMLATPSAVLSAIGHGAREGILFKGGVFVERLAAVQAIGFDKTGILTAGTPAVVGVEAFGTTPDNVLGDAAALERQATHPLAAAVVAAARAKGLPEPEARSLVTHHGRGVVGMIGDRAVWAGNEVLAAAQGASIAADVREAVARHAAEGRTVILVGTPAGVHGVIALADATRPAAPPAVAALRRQGLGPLVMVTGDRPGAAKRVAEFLGLDEAHAGLLPDEKLRILRQLGERAGPVAMVGDGINDGPALAAAHVGITLGMASEVALEVSDVVLVTNDLERLPYAVALARKARRVIAQNLVIAATVIATGIPLALTGLVSLPFGVVMHEGSTLVVVANGLRLLRRLRKEGT